MFTSLSHLNNYRRAQELLRDPAMLSREFWVHDWGGRVKLRYADALVAVLTDDRMDDSVNSLPYLVRPCPMLKPDDYGRDEESYRTNSRYTKVALYGNKDARAAIDAEIERKIARLSETAKEEMEIAKEWEDKVKEEFPDRDNAVIIFRTKRFKKEGVTALELVLLRPERIKIRGFGCFLEDIKPGEVVIESSAANWLAPLRAKQGMMGLEFFDTDNGVIIAGLFRGMYNCFVGDNVNVNGEALRKLEELS